MKSTLASYLKERREKRNLTLQELSEKIGYSAAYISMVENEKKKKPSYEFLSAIAKGLGLNYNYLLYSAGYIDHEDYNKIVFQDETEFIKRLNEEINDLEGEEDDGDGTKLKQLRDNLNKREERLVDRKNKRLTTPKIDELEHLLKPGIRLFYKGIELSDKNKNDIKIFIEHFITKEGE